MNSERIVIVGGGAAGFFAAHRLRGIAKRTRKSYILEKTSQFLSKVKISGGGRCNVTHADFDAREFSRRFPRGERALISAFGKFQASDTVAWFESRGVKLKIEPDGRMFPTTDSSQTIIDCLLNEAQKAGIKLKTNCGVERAIKKSGGGFELELSNGEILSCDKLLLAIGGCRTPALGQLAVSLGHIRLNRPCRRCSRFTLNAVAARTGREFPLRRPRRLCLEQNFASAARCCSRIGV
jgi:predicted Rossmann fold flavoprotein